MREWKEPTGLRADFQIILATVVAWSSGILWWITR